VINKKNYKSWTVTCQDADTTTTVAHGFVTAAGVGFAPDLVTITSTLNNGGGSATTAVVTWGVTVDATNLYLTKLSLTGSGGTSPGTTVVAKVNAWKPHSIAE
jgi:hypothetical protein